MSGVLRVQELPGQVIWSWNGSTGFVQHEVRCNLARLGATYRELRAGDEYLMLPQDTGTLGREEAAELVRAMRESGADCLVANRALVAAGYQATEHAERPDCNCMECD